MEKISHREKLRIARRNMSKEERKKNNHVSPFQSKAWEFRKQGIKNRVNKTIKRQQEVAKKKSLASLKDIKGK